VSSRRRRREDQRREAERKRRKDKRLSVRLSHHPRAIALALLVAVLVLLAFLVPKAPPDYVSCGAGAEAQHFHAYIFIQVGDGEGIDTHFIRVPDSMGLKSYCAWPIHVHEGAGARGPYFTLIHIEAPVPISAHAYTLGDALESWAEWAGGSYRLGPDGVSVPPDPRDLGSGTSFSGSTEVRTATDPAIMNDTNGPWNYAWSSQPASPGIVLQDGTFYHIIVH
jgi:hypothetical protein